MRTWHQYHERAIVVNVQLMQFGFALVARSEVRSAVAKFIPPSLGEQCWCAIPVGWCRKEGGDVAMEGAWVSLG